MENERIVLSGAIYTQSTIQFIQGGCKMKDHKSLASEMLHEEQRKRKYWQAAFYTVLLMLIVAAGAVCYLLLAR